jgi:hypothetical protein
MALFQTPDAAASMYSTVRNVDSAEKYFGFLPPHGRRLASGEEITVWGDIQHHLTKLTPNNRAKRSLESALDTSDGAALALVASPAVHLYDETLDETKILTLDNGSFAAADPSWGAYSSSATGNP